MKKLSLVAGVLALLGGLVYAGTTIKPFRASGGVQLVPTGTWLGQADMGGIYYKADGGVMAHNPNNTETLLGAGGGGVTFPLSNGSSSVTFNYGGTQSGTTLDYSSRATNAATVGDKLWSWGDTAEAVALKLSFAAGWDFVGTTANMGLMNNNGDGIRAQGANNIYIYGAGAAQVNWLANNGMMPLVAGMYNGATSANNFWGLTVSQHYASAGTAPTKAAGACIGGTQTVTLDANAKDASGNITLTGTATGTASAICVTVTFNAAYATAPHCTINPANAAAAALGTTAALFVDSASTTTSVFVIKVGSTALVAGTYIYTYDCMQ
jgi:hypothetical protein